MEQSADVQAIVDEERGWLDRSHGVGCGFSGPVTDAYLRGFGSGSDEQARASAAAQRANCVEQWGRLRKRKIEHVKLVAAVATP
jgi:hypothetical protein